MQIPPVCHEKGICSRVLLNISLLLLPVIEQPAVTNEKSKASPGMEGVSKDPEVAIVPLCTYIYEFCCKMFTAVDCTTHSVSTGALKSDSQVTTFESCSLTISRVVFHRLEFEF